MKTEFLKKIILIAIPVLLVSACDFDLEDPKNTSDDQTLMVRKLTSVPLKVDGMDSTTFEARIPKDAGHLDINFKTTLGTFPRTASKEIKEYADSIIGNYRFAYVTFKAGNDIGTANITVETIGQRRRILVTLTR